MNLNKVRNDFDLMTNEINARDDFVYFEIWMGTTVLERKDVEM